jgi:hypothetical protein
VATDRQIAANRRNALRSSGPRTQEGKDQSRRNALTHGLTAETLVIDGEDAEAFQDLLTRAFASYQPQDVVEEHLVERLVGLTWRLRRLPALEAAAIAWMQTCHRPEAGSSSPKPGLGRAVFHMIRDGDLLAKIGRYEGHLVNQLANVIAELERRLPKTDP